MAAKRWYYDMRCCHCGRFVKPDADSAAPYGRCTDLDPPDDEYYCDKCIKRLKAEYIAAKRVSCEYRLAWWQEQVIDALGITDPGLGDRLW